MNESLPAKCPQCGATLADSAEGLCPRCLLALNIAPQTQFTDAAVNTPGAPKVSRISQTAPLSPEELAPHFPQLEILECLGRGGMGVVYKARQKILNRFIALKLLAPERVDDPKFAERFTHEAQALAALSHPNIVTIHDFGQAGGFYYLLMEFVDGVNLRQAMKAGRFTPEEAIAVVPPVCEALQFAHERGIVHRDIKPENLLLDKEGRVKIADFGIAKILGADSATGLAETQPAGTPQYMAPEQRDHRRTDHRADIYSLGVVLYEMLTGELPADKLQPPSSRMGGIQIDVRLDEIVLRALEKQPELRYQQASIFKTQVETIAQSPTSAIGVPTSATAAAAIPVEGTPAVANWFQGFIAQLGVHSPGAVKCARLAGLGCLGFLGCLGAIPRLESLRGLFGLFGLFGLLGVAVIMEILWRKGPPPSASQRQPHFSRTAIVGACWAPLFFIAFVLMFTARSVPTSEYHGPAWWQLLLARTLLPLGATAPFGTTVLGWVAISQIRSSAGKLHGLGLAVFDGLLFPLLILDYGIAYFLNQLGIALHLWTQNYEQTSNSILTVCSIVAWVVVDWLIIRRAWRAVKGPVNG